VKLTKINEWLNPHKNNKPQWYITLDDETEAVCYSEKILEVKVGDDLPPDVVLQPGVDGKKPMLKFPGEGGKKGGYNALSFAERLDLDRFHELSTNARTAVMQALIRHPADDAAFFGFAERIYAWLQSKSSEPTTSRAGSDMAGAGSSPPKGSTHPASAPSSGSDEAHTDIPSVGTPSTPDPEPSVAGAEGEAAPATANHAHEWKPSPVERMAAKGWEVCTVEGCKVSEPREKHAA
jgi:hypothetical protein